MTYVGDAAHFDISRGRCFQVGWRITILFINGMGWREPIQKRRRGGLWTGLTYTMMLVGWDMFMRVDLVADWRIDV